MSLDLYGAAPGPFFWGVPRFFLAVTRMRTPFSQSSKSWNVRSCEFGSPKKSQVFFWGVQKPAHQVFFWVGREKTRTAPLKGFKL